MGRTIEAILDTCGTRFEKQPRVIPSYMGVDAPLMGNGNMVCGFAGWEKAPEFYITANDFWRLENSGKLGHSGPRPAARLIFDIPAVQGGRTVVEQNLYSAETTLRAEKAESVLNAVFRISADENLLMAEFSPQGTDMEISARFDSFPINMVAPYDTFLATGTIANTIEIMVPAVWKDRVSSIRLCDGETPVKEFPLSEAVPASDERKAMPWNGILDGAAMLYTDRVNFRKVRLACEVEGVHGCRDGIVLSTGFWAACGGYTNGFFVREGKWALRWYDRWVVSEVPAAGKTSLEAIVENEKITLLVGGRPAGTCILDYYPEESRGCDRDKLFATRRYAKGVALPTEASCAAKFLNSARPDAVLVKAGETVRFVLALRTLFKTATPLKSSAWRIASLDADEFDSLTVAHRVWWRNFWDVSAVEFKDAQLLKSYYLSQYLLGSLSRDPEFPPHIFGIMTSDYPEWNGDYHLNYNHQVPFLAMYSSGRLAQADPYDAPILAYMDRGTYHAAHELGLKGVYYPCGIGPKGTDTAAGLDEPGLFHGQKSNAAFSCVNLAMRWYSSYDPEYGMRIYPMVRRTAEFWENYVVCEGGQYVILNDAVQENSGEDKNGILSLGLLKMVLELGIDIAAETGIQDGKREKWAEILSRLAPFPVRTVAQVLQNGLHIDTVLGDKEEIFVLSEGGRWAVGCTLVTQHIYPAGAVGPGDDAEFVRIARNTVRLKTEYDGMNGAWRDFNHMSMFYPAAVRVGYDKNTVWRELKSSVADLFWENGYDAHAPFAENLSLVPNTVNEMLLQSYKGIIRVFYAWPAELEPDASFEKLVAHGAFEVSASMSGGKVQTIDILSRRGRSCRVQNPWKSAIVSTNAAPSFVTDETVICLETVPGQRICLRPAW